MLALGNIALAFGNFAYSAYSAYSAYFAYSVYFAYSACSAYLAYSAYSAYSTAFRFHSFAVAKNSIRLKFPQI